jgi:hypothetical protein
MMFEMLEKSKRVYFDVFIFLYISLYRDAIAVSEQFVAEQFRVSAQVHVGVEINYALPKSLSRADAALHPYLSGDT